MGVQKTGEKYRCNICGNEVVVTKAGGGTLVCCGEDMELIEQQISARSAEHREQNTPNANSGYWYEKLTTNSYELTCRRSFEFALVRQIV